MLWRLAHDGVPGPLSAAAMIVVFICTRLQAQISSGMGHVLQAFFAFLARQEQNVTMKMIGDVSSRAGARVGIRYRQVFPPHEQLPEDWQSVESRTISDDVACGEPMVTFYSVVPDEASILARRLRQFARELPSSVTWQVSL